MRIIIELDAGTQITTSASQLAVSSPADVGSAINAGPPRLDGSGLDTRDATSFEGAEDVGGPPEDLVLQIEATRAIERADLAARGLTPAN